MALVSKEAREAKMLEFMQYAPGLMALPPQLRMAIFEELGLDKKVEPQGPDVQRAKRILSWIRQGDFDRVYPMHEDDPYIFYEIFVNEMKTDAFYNLDEQQQTVLFGLVDLYKQQIEQIEKQQQKMLEMQAAAEQGGGGGPVQ